MSASACYSSGAPTAVRIEEIADMTVQEFIASGTEKSTADLLHAFEQTTADKRDWQPEGARCAQAVVAECGLISGGLAEVVSAGAFPDFDMEQFGKDLAALDTDDKAIEALKVGTAKLVAAIKAIPDDRLDVPIVSPWGTYSTAAWAAHALTHNAYHEGQICYIQTMYGDK